MSEHDIYKNLNGDEDSLPDIFNISESDIDYKDLPESVIIDRVAKTHYTMKAESPGPNALYELLKAGKEGELREGLAADEDKRLFDARLDILKRVASKRPQDMTEFEINTVLGASRRPKHNPRTVLETMFARHWMNDVVVNQSKVSEVFPKAIKNATEDFLKLNESSSNLVARAQLFSRYRDKLQSKWNKLPWLDTRFTSDSLLQDKLGSYIQTIIPFVNWYNSLNNFKDAPTTSLLPGTNIEEQLKYAWSVPIDEIPDLLDQLDDLADHDMITAMSIAEGLVRYGSNETFIRDVLAGIELGIEFAGVAGPLGRLASRIGRKAAREAPDALKTNLPATIPERTQSRSGTFKTAPRDFTAPGPRLLPAPEERKLLTYQRPSRDEDIASVGRQEEMFPQEELFTSSRPSRDELPYKPRNTRELKVAKRSIGPATRFERFGNEDELAYELGFTTPAGRDRQGRFVRQIKQQELPLETPSYQLSLLDDTIGEPAESIPRYTEIRNQLKPDDKLSPAILKKKFGITDKTHARTILSKLHAQGLATKPNSRNQSRVLSRKDIEKKLRSKAREDKRSRLQAARAFKELGKFQVEKEELVTAFTDTVMAATTPRTDPQRVLNKIGDIDSASSIGAAREMKSRATQTVPKEPDELEPLHINAPHLFLPYLFYKGVDAVSGMLSSKIAEKATARAEKMLKLLDDSLKVARRDDETILKSIEITKKFDLEGFGSMQDALYNAEPVFPFQTKANAGHIKYWFGKPKGGGAFGSKEEAANFATSEIGFKLPRDGFTVRQEGTGWYVIVRKPIRETMGEIKDHLIETSSAKVPDSIGMSLLGFLRGSDSLTNVIDTLGRMTATSAQSETKLFIQEALSHVQNLSNRERRELMKVLEDDRAWSDPNDPNRIGRFHQHISDFERRFFELNDRMPSPEQIDAYVTTVQVNDYDGALRNLAWLRDLTRQGAEMTRIHIPSQTPSRTEDGRFVSTKKPTQWFLGRRVRDIDWNSSSDPVIFVWDHRNNKPFVLHKHDKEHKTEQFKNNLKKRIKEGRYQIIEVANPTAMPLKEDLGVTAPIHYVVTDSAQFKPLRVGDINEWRPGGHVVYMQPLYLKQPNVRKGYKGRTYFFGDKTILGLDTEKDARHFERIWNEAQDLLKQGNDTQLENYLKTSKLPFSLKEFKKFYTEAGPGGGLVVDVPVKFTRAGKGVFDTHPNLKEMFPDLKNQLTAPDMMSSLDKRFVAERGPILKTAKNKGSESNPIWRVETSRLLNPYAALSRAMGNSIKGRWMGDYKHLATEHWIESFANILTANGTTREMLRRNPLHYILNPPYNKSVDNFSQVVAAENARNRIINFIGYKSDTERELSFLENKIIEQFGGVHDTDSWKGWLQNGILESISDPYTHARAFAFRLNMGLYNPVQIMVQSQTFTNMWAISPQHTPAALAGYTVQRAMLRTENPAIWRHYAKMVNYLWDEDEFIESFEEMKKAGWHNVGGEVAWRDSIKDTNFFQSRVGRFIDKGDMFFSETERAIRMGGWNIAFREWKRTNPTKALTDFERAKILKRADDLTVNMTRASNASWQNGFLSLPTQYFSYQARLMEQIWEGLFQTGAKKLTRPEAARLLGTLSIFYGVPVGIGSTLGFRPVYEDIKMAAMNRNVNIDNNFFRLAHEGLASTLTTLVTGKEYNIAERLGPGGNEAILESFRGNKELHEIVFGASGSTFKSLVDSASTMVGALWSSTVGTGDFPLTMDDFIDVSREIKSVNNVSKMIFAMQTQLYITKNQGVIGPVDNIDAVAMGILGLKPLDHEEAFSKIKYEKALKDHKEQHRKEAIKELRKSLKRSIEGDEDTAARHMRRYRAILETGAFTWNERNQIFGQALDQNENLIQQIDRRRRTRELTTPE